MSKSMTRAGRMEYPQFNATYQQGYEAGRAAALAERETWLLHEIALLRAHTPSDASKPAWFWDGWHAALDMVDAALAENPKKTR